MNDTQQPTSTRKSTSFRTSDLMARQLVELNAATGLNQSEIISTAVDRMYRDECRPMPQTRLNPRRNKGLVELVEKMLSYHNGSATRHPELIATLDDDLREYNENLIVDIDFLSSVLTSHVVLEDDPDPEYTDPWVSSEERLIDTIMEFQQRRLNDTFVFGQKRADPL